MKTDAKREFVIDKQIERFCESTSKVLTKIHDRIDEEQSKEQKKKKKTEASGSSE